MSTHVVRVWLPDRPGALGAVASRIGAVRGDLIGIDILERGAGRAIDELVVKLPSDDLVALLIDEMSEVDGVDVEDVRPVKDSRPDPRVGSLETAAVLVEQRSVGDLLGVLAHHARHDFEADWVVLVGPDGAEGLAAVGDVPPPPWLQ
ncbi:MAG: amino acid-binding protein, partial [Actinomycetota bacterium]|nr:amino acid-binding protein [Actinomycetota bacterium]